MFPNRKKTASVANQRFYACEIFPERKPLTGPGATCIILPSAARRSSRGRPGAAPANRKGSWHTRKRLDGLRLVGGTDWRVGRRTLLLHPVGGRKPVARGQRSRIMNPGVGLKPDAAVSPEARKNGPSSKGPPSSGAAPGRKIGRRSLFVLARDAEVRDTVANALRDICARPVNALLPGRLLRMMWRDQGHRLAAWTFEVDRHQDCAAVAVPPLDDVARQSLPRERERRPRARRHSPGTAGPR